MPQAVKTQSLPYTNLSFITPSNRIRRWMTFNLSCLVCWQATAIRLGQSWDRGKLLASPPLPSPASPSPSSPKSCFRMLSPVLNLDGNGAAMVAGSCSITCTCTCNTACTVPPHLSASDGYSAEWVLGLLGSLQGHSVVHSVA